MSEWTDRELFALRRLIAKAEVDPEFSPEEIAALCQMVEAFKGFQYLGRFAKWVVFLLAALAGGIAAWEQVTEKVRAWLGG